MSSNSGSNLQPAAMLSRTLSCKSQKCHLILLHASTGGVDTYEALYNFFLGRVRDRLHVCLCFSPVGPQFAKRAQQFPGLINGTTIDWFLPWPEEALISVADKFLAEFPMVCTEEVRSTCKCRAETAC